MCRDYPASQPCLPMAAWARLIRTEQAAASSPYEIT